MTDSQLTQGSSSVIRYVARCGTQSGRVTLRIRRPHGSALLGFSANARAIGPGAAGPLRCRLQPGGWVFCGGRKHGPVTFHGSVSVAPRTRCEAKLLLDVWRWTGDSLDFPAGCPHSYTEPERKIGRIISKRAYYGLDRDLHGNRTAIVRRAKGLLSAWRRGNPVARWTSLEEAFGMPLRASEQVELEYRETYRRQFQHLVEDTDWVTKNASSSYAGYELDEAAGGIIYVGFTTEPVATLDRLKQRLIAPEQFKPFPITPTYTEAELGKILTAFPPPGDALWNLVNSASIDYLGNKIEVGTQHVARVRALIADRYGPTTPFEVVFQRPAVLA